MKFSAVGDTLILRRMPHYEGFDAVRDWICQGDARYFNLETTLHREGECYGFAINGGSYLRSDPEIVDDCKQFGFNLTSFCNNHTMDFSYEGLLKTFDHVTASGLVHAGVGKNLDQAAAPAYLDTPNARVALLSMTATCNSYFDDVCRAGRQSRRAPGRPGVNQLRYNETLFVTQDQMDQLKQIAAQTAVNLREDIGRAEGFRDPLPEGTFKLGKNLTFKLAEATGRETVCHPADLKRMETNLYEARSQADFVLVSIHSHEVGRTSKEDPAQFLEEFAHFCIDNGADAVIGHGPHLLRPIEIYKGKPIFYSLGDFIMQTRNLNFSVEEEYTEQGLTSDAPMQEVRRTKSKDFTRGLRIDRRMYEAVIPRWEVVDGKITKLELLPIELGFDLPASREGLPRVAKDDSILRRLAEMSAPYGTKMEIKDNIATVIL